MPESEVGTPSTATPGTTDAPLFTSLRVHSTSNDRQSMPRGKCLPRCKCLSCLPSLDISLTRKVVSFLTVYLHLMLNSNNEPFNLFGVVLGGGHMQLGAEFVGTFILIFSAAAGPIVNQKHNGVETLIGNALCAGLAVMIVVLSTGHISGAHLNPSVTIAFAALRHFPWLQVPLYIAVQVSASICAAFVLKAAFHPFMSGGVTVPSVSNGQAFVLEFIITFILLFVINAVATDTRAVIKHSAHIYALTFTTLDPLVLN
ncbi:hypothetical protein RHSIM_Rhsim13G0013800 [Rhododendron simsii]|uniref:Aquaporin n=1 Tax=Rhododendron simsii TaxID=118357 RepID=A0A834G4A3_RHOSS|nr:hypothetical protein RHSIM_Rhsim13G0013800 [Rhododendron simsii]